MDDSTGYTFIRIHVLVFLPMTPDILDLQLLMSRAQFVLMSHDTRLSYYSKTDGEHSSVEVIGNDYKNTKFAATKILCGTTQVNAITQ